MSILCLITRLGPPRRQRALAEMSGFVSGRTARRPPREGGRQRDKGSGRVNDVAVEARDSNCSWVYAAVQRFSAAWSIASQVFPLQGVLSGKSLNSVCRLCTAVHKAGLKTTPNVQDGCASL